MQDLEPNPSLGSNPSSATSQVCDLWHIAYPHEASVLSSFKGTNNRSIEPGVKYEVFRAVPGTQ